MADFATLLVNFFLNNLILIIIACAIPIAAMFIYKFIRKIPKNPDYVKIFQNKAIEDEKLNLPDKFEPHFLFRGERYLGKILSYNVIKLKYNPTPEDRENPKDKRETEVTDNLATVVYKPHTTGRLHLGKKTMIKFLKEDVNYEGLRIVIPSNLAITAMGDCYFVHQDLGAAVKSIEANWSRRFAEAQMNAMANQMLKVSGFITEYAQERRLRELEIQKIEAEKKLKMGNVI